MSVLIVADRDGDCQVALQRGFGLAKAMGWDVEVVACCYESTASLDSSDQREAKRRLQARCRESLSGWIKQHHPEGVDVKPIVVWEKSVSQWVNSHVRRNPVNVVVKTGHRTETLLYTPTDWHLLRECEAPVLIATDRLWHPKRSVVAAVDFGSRSGVKRKLNDAVARMARQYADALACPLHIIYVIQIPSVLKDLDVIDERAQVDRIRRRLQPEVTAFARKHAIAEDRIRMAPGEVHRVVPSMSARLRAQLVVMGMVGRAGAMARLIGNTAERVLTRLGADVLALKPEAAGPD